MHERHPTSDHNSRTPASCKSTSKPHSSMAPVVPGHLPNHLAPDVIIVTDPSYHPSAASKRFTMPMENCEVESKVELSERLHKSDAVELLRQMIKRVVKQGQSSGIEILDGNICKAVSHARHFKRTDIGSLQVVSWGNGTNIIKSKLHPPLITINGALARVEYKTLMCEPEDCGIIATEDLPSRVQHYYPPAGGRIVEEYERIKTGFWIHATSGHLFRVTLKYTRDMRSNSVRNVLEIEFAGSNPSIVSPDEYKTCTKSQTAKKLCIEAAALMKWIKKSPGIETK